MGRKKKRDKFDFDIDDDDVEEEKDTDKEIIEENTDIEKKEEVKSKKKKNKKEEVVDEKIQPMTDLEKTIRLEAIDEIKETVSNGSGIDVFTPKNTFGRILTYLLLSITFVSVICLFIYTIIMSKDSINRISTIIGVGILSLFTLFFLVQSLFLDNKKGRVLVTFSSLLLTFYSVFTITTDMGLVIIPTQDYVPNFTGKNLTEVVDWASKNNITLNQIYETSDSVKEYGIISQDVDMYTLVKNVSVLTVTISEGPNYEKEVVVPNFIGKSVDDVVNFIDLNYLTNVNINFEFSEDEREIILTQDNSGQLKRNAEINLTASLGIEDSFTNVEMIDLKGESLFKATLFLKRNAIKYKLEYDYSDSVKRNYVISQNIDNGSDINIKENEVVLVISKGPKINVPDLTNMSVEDITNWVVENNLKIAFEERYDEAKKAGDVISASNKMGDVIEQGILITIVISKGQLRMEDFKKATEFREWAEKYNINYKEEYEFNDNVSSGSIIKSSHKVGDVIKNNDTVIIYVSQGKSVKIPNFIGSSKSDITKKCNSLGLKCSFSYGSYSDSVGKDVATNQNKKSGSTVATGTSVNITLSLGKAKRYTVYIQPAWFSNGNADATIATLKQKLTSLCPGVTFNFKKKTVNTGVGIITSDSPTQGGNQTFIQGKTYTFYIGS